ncbi:hypothetical protein LTR16_010546, partial [Cryomyces antarcticus]
PARAPPASAVSRRSRTRPTRRKRPLKPTTSPSSRRQRTLRTVRPTASGGAVSTCRARDPSWALASVREISASAGVCVVLREDRIWILRPFGRI